MNCHAVRNVLDLYAEGRLTPRREKAAAAHLAGCAECRARLSPAPSPSGARAPEALKARILAAAKAARGASAPAPRRAPELALWPREASGVAVAALALALLALALGWSGAPSQAFDDSVAAGRLP